MCSSNLSDESLADKFKMEHTEQFHILVRMHLSFVLDLNTDENECFSDKGKLKKWNFLVPFGRKAKSSRSVMEGAPLTQEGICQVYQLIEFLKKEQNLKIEGIFRRTGSLERQQELRNILNQGVTLELEGSAYSVHDCASVLKGFLAELPDPLLTETYFPAYCQIAELCGVVEQPTQDAKLLEALQLVLLLLPSENKVLLKDILELLHLTAAQEHFNKMSPDNLAKLFTPHLLCPRKLSPENLLTFSQTLFGIVSFMIKNSMELFKIPTKLIVDFRARYEKYKKIVCSPSGRPLNDESVTDAASTVFTFVDHERTAKENEANPTETALAQLYAHIQSMPESSKKRKLVKQFNKENGHGTPLQVIRSSMPKNRSIGGSIKKHIFQRGLVKSAAKKAGFAAVRTSNEDILNSPHINIISKARLFCGNCDSSSDVSNDDDRNAAAKKHKSRHSDCDQLFAKKHNKSGQDNSLDNERAHSSAVTVCITSTPACLTLRACPDIIFTPEEQDRKSMSPITRSTQRMTKAMQETMMTPRSRKPVLLMSGTNINALQEPHRCAMDNVTEEVLLEEQTTSEESLPMAKTPFKKSKSEGDITCNRQEVQANCTDTPSSLTSEFREYLSNRDMVTMSSPADADLSFSSRTDDFNSTELSDSKITDSLLFCLNGNEPQLHQVLGEEICSVAPLPKTSSVDEDDADNSSGDIKELVLKPKQFDQNGKAIVFETSF